ncbi:hypothetical protein F383_19652 [Gossypium arboreum]|uniref:Uncharacterized protein n=1 Tax=Gossypium arboreum TaxID=29729 RepID=A0A0B0NM24_GOSAR|nr:hypothetical protein F383_19652 [Gossypium arboreum]
MRHYKCQLLLLFRIRSEEVRLKTDRRISIISRSRTQKGKAC